MAETNNDDLWDVIVIGTGMGGATIGYCLASQGFRVIFLEKGHEVVADGAFGNLAEAPEQRLAEGCWPDRIIAEVDGAVSEQFAPLGCGPGGSTLLYAAALERFERSDFDAIPGLEHPTRGWPISYDAMRPYYERAERLYRVRGTSDPLGEPAELANPPQASVQDELFMRDFARAGLHPYRLHVGIAYQPGCRECLGRLCPTACKSTARSICLDPALEYYEAKLLTDCEITRLIGAADCITGVEFRRSNTTEVMRGRVVVLAAGTYRSATLLLLSASSEYPNGLANGSGLVGRNLMFHSSDLIAVWPQQRASSDGPRKAIGFRDLYSHDGKRLGSVQSIGLSASYGNILVYLYAWFDKSCPAWVRPLRPFLRIPALIASKLFGPATIFAMILEDFGEPHNRIVPDPDRPERIRICYRVSRDLRQRTALARRLLRERLSGFRIMNLRSDVMVDLGHPTGTCRFGHDPTTSVLDPSCRSHEIKNLYVVDGSFMPSSGGTNPALTIAANALRVGDIIGARLRDGRNARIDAI
jgi:choline dehydrogenase-like flavoprotein